MFRSIRRAVAAPQLPVDPVAAAKPVLDLDGAPHPLASLWAERAVVLVFLRHFG